MRRIAVRKVAGLGVRRIAVEAPAHVEAGRTAAEVVGPATAEGGRLEWDSLEEGILGEAPVSDSPEEAGLDNPEEGAGQDSPEEDAADTAAAAGRKVVGTGLGEGLQELREEAADTGLAEGLQEAAGSSSLPEGAAAGRMAVDCSFVIVW